jgi:hypothetical protein
MIREVPASQVRKSLLSKGFCEPEHHKGRDHEYFFFHVEDHKTPFLVKLSNGTSRLRVDEIRNTASKNGVSGDDIYRIVCCDFNAQQTMEVYKRSRWPQMRAVR